jgi:predicted Zn finger-like uncharacterized protein
MKIIECTHCGMKYRLDPAKFAQSQLRIRCKRCENTFEADLATAPDAAAAAPAAPATPPAPPVPPTPPAAAPTPAPAADGAPAAPTAPVKGEGRLVLVAHDDDSVRAGMVAALSAAGFAATEADNGVDALAIIQRQRPRVAVLDVTLPKVFGFEICEIVRRDPELADVRLMLIAAIYDQNRYKRPPQQLYGADDYIEKQDVPAGLVAKVGALADGESTQAAGFGGGNIPGSAPASPPTPAAPEPAAPTPAAPEPAAPEPAAPEPAAAAPAAAPGGEAIPTAAELGLSDDDFKRMRRLARTIVSDIVLYNQDKVEAGVRAGDLAGALADELTEGRQLFAERLGQLAVDPSPFMNEYLGEIEVGKRREYGLDG